MRALSEAFAQNVFLRSQNPCSAESQLTLLIAVAIFLISNTIAMGIELRKEEISIMKYVGGTDFFVRSPFVIEGLVIGVVGSAIPLIILYFFYNRNEFPYLSLLFLE